MTDESSTNNEHLTQFMQLPSPNLPSHISNSDSHRWLKDWPLWLPLACLSWWLAWRFQDAFISDWDGFDYTAQAVQGLPTALGLGRALFLGYNHWLWRLAHKLWQWPPAEAYLVLRYAVIAQTGFAIIALYALFKELTAQRFAAALGTLLVVMSPYFIIYSGRSMSEIPGLLWLGSSLWWMVRSLRLGRFHQYLLAAFLLGLSANQREFAVFYFPAILLIGRVYGATWWRCLLACGLAVLAAFAGMIFWSIYDQPNYLNAVINWYRLSAKERELNPVTAENLVFLAHYAFENSAILTLLGLPALAWLAARRERYALLWVGLCGLAGNAALVMNHDLSVNPRYLMIGLPGLAAVCGWALSEWLRWLRWRSLPLICGLLILTQGTYHEMARELYNHSWAAWSARDYYASISDLPWHAAFIVGARTPLVHFYKGVGAHPYWAVIAPGSGWPDEKLDYAIADLMMAGRSVYVDFNPELWQTGAREKSREHAGLEHIRNDYELEHIRHQLYRIVRRKETERWLAYRPGNFCKAAIMPTC